MIYKVFCTWHVFEEILILIKNLGKYLISFFSKYLIAGSGVFLITKNILNKTNIVKNNMAKTHTNIKIKNFKKNH